MEDRISRLLSGLDLSAGRGLEFGALTTPVLRRPQHEVLYLDHLPTALLREKYASDPAVNAEAIVPVDVVWTGTRLRDAVSVEFDHVVASHVIEHVPDLLGWFAEIDSVLKTGGALRLIVPDRRFTMDLSRRETSVADVIAAQIEQRHRPSAKDIIDFYINYRVLARERAWEGLEPPEDGASAPNYELAVDLARSSVNGAYHDVHCSVFTPRSFARLMSGLASFELHTFACERLMDTQVGEIDFFVHLRRSSDRQAIKDSWRDVVDLLSRTRPPVGLLQDEPGELRRSLRALSEEKDTFLLMLKTANERQLSLHSEIDAVRARVQHQTSIRGSLACLRAAVVRRLRSGGLAK